MADEATPPNTVPNEATIDAEREDERAAHTPDAQDGSAPAPPKDKADPKVAKAYEDAMKRGVDAPGEGNIEGVHRSSS
jgi:hypothetical protein